MTHKLKIILLFILYFHVFGVVHSQYSISGSPLVRNYTSATIPNITQTWCMGQDKSGLMYFGNSSGLTIFDGNTWRVYHLANNSIVQALLPTENNLIFAGGIDELGFFTFNDPVNFRYHSLVDKIPAEDRNFGIVKGIFTLDEQIIFLTVNKIIILKGNEIKIIRAETLFNKGFIVNNLIYVFEKDIGLMLLSSNGLQKVPGSEIFGASPNVLSYQTDKSELIVVSQDKGCFLWNGQTFQPCFSKLSEVFQTFGINCVTKLKNNRIVFGTATNGLIVANESGEIVQIINKNRGLDNNRILSVYEDVFDNLWIGHDNGVSYLEINSPFTYFNEQYVPGTGYAATFYDNKLYLGTSQGLFSKSYADLSSTKAFEQVNGTQGQVWNLFKTDKQLLLGHNDGTFVINGYESTKISDVSGGWAFIQLAKNPNYLLQGTYSGFVLFQKTGTTWKYLRRINGFDESCRIFDQDKNGLLWVTHGYKGVFSIELDSTLKNAVEVKFYGKENGFPSNLGINVFNINKELLFTSEYGGIYIFDPNSSKFIPYTKFDEYLGKKPKISRMYQDAQGNIWINEIDRTGVLIKLNNGAYEYKTQPFRKLRNSMVKGFELFSVMPGNEVLFGYGAGFICYNPNVTKNYNAIYHTLLRKIELISNPDSVIYFGGIIDSSYLELPYKYNSLRFSYSAPYFEDNDEVKYTYFLEGFDTDWSGFTKKTEREYTNLPEGKYIFRVKAQNIYQVESLEGTFKFEIRPPITHTWWAYIVYSILLGMLIYAFFSFYKTKKEIRLRRENILKDREIVRLKNLQLSGEIELKNEELGNLTTLIVKKNEVLQQVKDYLNNIYKNVGAKEQKEIIQIARKIDEEADIDKEWASIEPHFDTVYKGFISKLKTNYLELKSHDIKLCAYIQMNLSSKEIAVLMNNTPHGVEAHRYRLRKTFGLTREDNLKEFLNML